MKKREYENIELNDKETNKRIDMVCSRIPGKPTYTKVRDMFLVQIRPDEKYIRAYLKKWY